MVDWKIIATFAYPNKGYELNVKQLKTNKTMKNLFDFCPTANVLHTILTKVSRVFIKQHKEDVLIDMKEMYNTLYNGYPIYASVRELGFDTINRFSRIDSDTIVKTNADFDKYKDLVTTSLGADAFIKIYPNELKMEIILNKEFDTNVKYELLGLEPMVSVNFVEKFGE